MNSPIQRPIDPARLYELIHRGNVGDVDFYSAACRGGHSILELGCGTGRVARAIAPGARRYVGLDLEPEMLTRLEHNLQRFDPALAEKISVVPGDMAAFELHERFDRIVIPYNGLFCLPDRGAVRSCFEHIRRHLAEDGLAIFDVYHVDGEIQGELEDIAADEGTPVSTEPEPLVRIDEGDAVIQVIESYDWYPREQRAVAHYNYIITTGDERDEQTQQIEHRYQTEEQLIDLIEQAELEVVDRRLGFDAVSHSDMEQLIFIVRGTG